MTNNEVATILRGKVVEVMKEEKMCLCSVFTEIVPGVIIINMWNNIISLIFVVSKDVHPVSMSIWVILWQL